MSGAGRLTIHRETGSGWAQRPHCGLPEKYSVIDAQVSTLHSFLGSVLPGPLGTGQG